MNNDSEEYGGGDHRDKEYRLVVKKIDPDETFDIPEGAVGVSIDWESAPLSKDKYTVRYAAPTESMEDPRRSMTAGEEI